MLVHIGFGNIVNTEKIIAIVSPESAPIKRLVQRAKEDGTAIDATQGRRTKSVLVMESGQVVLSALLPETIAGRALMPGQADGELAPEPETAGKQEMAGNQETVAEPETMGKPKSGITLASEE